MFAGRYFVGECLAQGGMGVVFAAKHVMTGEHVALKVLSPRTFGSKAAAKNFQLEARVASLLGGEHVVRILDAGFDEQIGAPFLAMELLHGRTLDALVRQQGPLAPAELLWALPQVAEALARAHGHVDRDGRPAPIVHRDLKPENLFLAERDRGGPIVKVLDFGIAKVLSERQTLSQELQGTPLFMASEQIEGGVLTTRVDIWALGLIAFYLLTGRHYWRCASKPEAGLTPLLNEVLRATLETPSERARSFGVTPSWGPAFDAWFFRCVDREPSRRFSSAISAILPLAEALGVEVGRAPTVLGPARARPSVEVPTPVGTRPVGPRGLRAKVAKVAKVAKAAAGASAPKPALSQETITSVHQRLAPRAPRAPFGSDLGGFSNLPPTALARLQPRRSTWGVFGFVAGGLLTALALRGGVRRSDVDLGSAASPAGLRVETAAELATPPGRGVQPALLSIPVRVDDTAGAPTPLVAAQHASPLAPVPVDARPIAVPFDALPIAKPADALPLAAARGAAQAGTPSHGAASKTARLASAASVGKPVESAPARARANVAGGRASEAAGPGTTHADAPPGDGLDIELSR
jgi:serine/threonine-protein kinase